ncbi:MAG TPA: amidase [Beijerinckiaceae bacterium]|nr:amidase [Beijerinckiaceae bacterium]
MKVKEYAKFDALGLAELVRRRQVTPKELALTAAEAIAKANGEVNCVVETYADRIDGLDETSLGTGPFRGVPFLMKDVFGHEKGRKIEFGSRLCKGMVGQVDSNLTVLLRKAGVNILGRSSAPEYSMAGTSEGLLYGNASNPWKKGYSTGGSSGGAQAAVTSGMVPIAHGSDIGGSIRIPASYSGGVGLKPSRMRISVGPTVDEGGFGYSMNHVQTMTVRDSAAMLDCLAHPMPGDPFVIPKPRLSYATLIKRAPKKLRVGIVLDPLLGVAVDPEVEKAVRKTGKALAGMGHEVEQASVSLGGVDLLEVIRDLFFFDFENRLNGYAKLSGHKPGPDTLEPVIWSIYQRAKEVTPSRFMAAWSRANVVRRTLGQFWTKYDLWLSPTTATTAPPWGTINLSLPGADFDSFSNRVFALPVQYTLPHNVMGTPAMSLPLAMHSNGLPIGVQIAAAPSLDHIVLQVAAALEQEMPWARRAAPPLHVSRF